ncbi:BamA/TamA family outer membrane protein [Hydrotalea sp.]|uniref:BamA/TamA family outer membrane protein n=1 Tax=Hydrotalea sp. TaxID=2881279 RepID=UPI00261729F6|nr:BamA/TamA family outer membrane protein [Hydrotalea sp.]
MRKLYSIFLLFFCICISAHAQTTFNSAAVVRSVYRGIDSSLERDLVDVTHKFFHKKSKQASDSAKLNAEHKYNLAIVPAVGYTLQTGFAGILSANIGYFNIGANKISSITTSITYSQYQQTIVPLVLNIWTKNDKFNIVSDNRFIDYPSSIYGLGGRTDPNKGHTIDFIGLKLHESVLMSVGKNVYAGLGYYYDQFWDIRAINPSTRRINTIITKALGYDETASGPVLKFLYDNRKNQINPTQGLYANFVLRNSFTFFDGDQIFQSLLIDVRKYLPFPHKYSKNTLALWSYNYLTVAGTPPYLLLASTGWDDQYNTGRGYIQGRFRGRNMVYLEGEYRYRISRSGLIGGVIFANVENFSGDLSQQYNTLLPGYGLGIRVKLNKHSGTNLCVDYGFGKNGSGGFYVNIGEVF